MPVSSRIKKLAKSLQLKKYRKQEQLFLVEGIKSVEELLRSDFEIQVVAGVEEFILHNNHVLDKRGSEAVVANKDELSKLGSFQTNDGALAIVKMKPNRIAGADNFCLVLDDLRDPGNLGTIVRTADWYGVNTIIASEETADFYNPKTISATMGSFCRVNVFYTDLVEFLSQHSTPVFGTFLDGQSIYQTHFGDRGMIVIGNESTGISVEVAKSVHHRISIPRVGKAESLNAGVATGIILDNVFRLKK